MQANTAMQPAVPAAQAGPAPKPRRKRSSARNEVDWRYNQAVEFVKRRRYVSLSDIRGLGIPIETARQMLLRMQREGVLDAPDMFGTWTRPQAQEVSHEG